MQTPGILAPDGTAPGQGLDVGRVTVTPPGNRCVLIAFSCMTSINRENTSTSYFEQVETQSFA